MKTYLKEQLEIGSKVVGPTQRSPCGSSKYRVGYKSKWRIWRKGYVRQEEQCDSKQQAV